MCCGTGGYFDFNTKVFCGNFGMVGSGFVNLTAAVCRNRAGRLIWDGIHTSDTFNVVVATEFLNGKHISPEGGLHWHFPDFSNFVARFKLCS